ncbi:MAG: histidinol dehydrogenase [Candidatus Palauibacterales bacterium]|nr:histidinol dehydrogenase [Candidatus Palauibacterales bacterium]MDP2530446.1 histidinol dehydrogenase [Candidatus Palauibacterales bacterium]MDP2584628.1 histidinol dehydrogenase [Candidatus Palauibacterales bacterium]
MSPPATLPDFEAILPVLSGDRARSWLERRSGRATARPDQAVLGILEAVRTGGDAALLDLVERFDGVRPPALAIPRPRWMEALAAVEPATRAALERASRNLERFHGAQRRREAPVEVEPGVVAWREFRPLDRVGVYVPGGLAAYPSSLLMAAVPARLAGCREVVVCSPPGAGGEPASPVLAAAALVGVDAVFAAGGAQAVAAMTWGTESVPAVDRIVGPGGRWVNAAKLAVSGVVAIDLPAGPSEVAVWADVGADPGVVAAELLAQAEHGWDSLSVAVLPDEAMAAKVRKATLSALDRTPRRTLAARSLVDSALLVAGTEAEALDWVNELAAEHLVLLREDADRAAASIRHAGSVFLGRWSPVAAGDYAAGTNHVLPTGRRARADDGLSLDDFGRWIQFQRLDRSGLQSLAPTVVALAEWEGLPAHAESVAARLGGGSRPGTGSRAPGPHDLVRPHLRELRGYRTARSEHVGGILLDANENPLGPPGGLDAGLARYPDPHLPALRTALAAELGTEPERVWIGNGSDEAIDLLVRTLADPGDPVGVASPSYGVYSDRVRAHGARVVPLPLDADFDLDVEVAVATLRDARLLFLCSPNNPTGNRLSLERIETLLERWPGVLALDEAYVEFARGDSLTPKAGGSWPRLVVLRTFSKAWGLAAARVGCAVADPGLVQVLTRAGLPYPLSTLSARVAVAALADRAGMIRRVADIVAERERVRRELEALGTRPLPSEANFLLFSVDDPYAVQRCLAEEHGVVVRDRSDLPRLRGGLRVSIGTRAENDRFLEGLARVPGVRAEPAAAEPPGVRSGGRT